MNGQIVSPENIATTPPKWQHPILPAPATQGNILITTTPFTTPPEDSSNFKWLPMEDLIGTADVKMEYDEVKNEFNFYKAKGHLDNNGEWHYDWEKFAVVVGISEETQRELQNLIYVSYIYDTTLANTLKVYGVKKNGELELLCNINFVSAEVLDTAINNLRTQLNTEVKRATNKENEINSSLQSEVSRATNRENEIEYNLQNSLNNEISRATNRENRIENTLQTAITNEITRATNSEQNLQNQVDDVRENLAEYVGNFATKAALDAYSGTVNNNDYAVVLDDETHDHQCWRYIYKESTHSWRDQYMVNEEPMTTAQLAALNSGINTTKVAQIETNRQDILTKQNILTQGNGITLSGNSISAKVNTNQGVRVDNNGIGIKLGQGLRFDSTGKVELIKETISVLAVDKANIEENNIQFNVGTEHTIEATYTVTAEDLIRYNGGDVFVVIRHRGMHGINRIRTEFYKNGSYIQAREFQTDQPTSMFNRYEAAEIIYTINRLKDGDTIKLVYRLWADSSTQGTFNYAQARITFR